MGGVFTGFDFRNIRDPQQRLDLFMEQHQDRVMDSLGDELVDLFFGDSTETKAQLERWKKRHPDDFSIVSRTGGRELLKIYRHGRDPFQEVVHNNFLRNKERQRERRVRR
jgi:hypothetical protein